MTSLKQLLVMQMSIYETDTEGLGAQESFIFHSLHFVKFKQVNNLWRSCWLLQSSSAHLKIMAMELKQLRAAFPDRIIVSRDEFFIKLIGSSLIAIFLNERLPWNEDKER